MEKESVIRDIGLRIKCRREELHMSQQELASRVGYKSRSSINKIELGKNDIPQSAIQKIANALDCTPGFLMGWRPVVETTVEAIRKDVLSGRADARDDMFDSYADETGGTIPRRLSNGKLAVLSYYVFDSPNTGNVFSDIVKSLNGLRGDDLCAIRGMISGYLSRNDRDY